MNYYDIEKIRNAFHVEPIQTRGNQKGVILKFPYFYLKIYDGNGESSYSVQVWDYGKQLPRIVDEIRCSDLISFISSL